MLEQYEEVELGEMELEISSSKVNPMISSPDSTCWQIEQEWEPDMPSFDCFLLPASPIEDFTLRSHSCSPATTTHHHHDHQESGPCGPCSELYYDFHLERGTSNVVSMTCLMCTFALSFSFHVQDLGDNTRFIEFYNLVFMQYNKKYDGDMWYVASLEGLSEQVHHTTSHLLQSSLKTLIGQEISQPGSMVAFDSLRFDFNFYRPVLDKEIVDIEGLINQWIDDSLILETKVMYLTDAKGVGAIAMFGEKYGEQLGIITSFC
ncbi:putative alanine--tRNA ligase, chloroplastic [Capsicum baccatum]|uniref:Alanine--tRNA ligase, chloroplastic n=1 Tax=Capsicum baccatum TaxID=33114 RepID=A0A2G2V9J3_CAPBA|nr:putative alanine--tRNA ligase, chloroplastic [Capsicum baccatum]